MNTERSPVENYVDQVLPADRLADMARSLPAHIRPELFKRNLLNVVMINWELMKVEAGLLFREVSKAAGLGLYLDPQLGEAYIVMAYNYKTKQLEPQLRIGYRGLTKLARQSGSVSLIYAHEVCANDHIVCRLGTEKQLVHEPKLFTDRGEIVGYYAVITFTDNAFDFEPMSVAEIRNIRDRSDAWKAFAEKKIKSTPWSSDESEMAKKTVIRRLMKRAPQSPEMVEALKIEDAAEGYLPERLGIAPRRAPSPSAPMIEAQPVEPAPQVEQQPEPAQPGRRAPSPSAAPKAPPKSVDAAQQAPVAQHYHPDTVRKNFAEALKACETMDQVNEAWQQIVDPWDQHLMPPDREDFAGMCRRREAEIDGQEGAAP